MKIFPSTEFEFSAEEKETQVIFLPKKVTLEHHPFWVVDRNSIPSQEGFVLCPHVSISTFDLYLIAFQMNTLPGIISLLYINSSGNYRKSLIKSKILNFMLYEIAPKYQQSLVYLQSLVQTAEMRLSEVTEKDVQYEERSFEVDFFSEIRNAIGVEFHVGVEIKEKTQVLERWNEFVNECSKHGELDAESFIKIFAIDNPVLTSVKRLHVMARNIVGLSLNTDAYVENT